MANAEPRHTTSNRYTSKLYQTMKTSYVRSISGINSSLFGAYWSSERKLEQSKRLSELKLSTGTVRTNIPKPKISQPHKNQQLDVNKNNPMYGKHHTEEAKQKMSATRRENYKTGGAEYQAKMVRANPRSRPVITPEGTFPSLSAARRHFGLVSKYSATIRIRQGEWKYS